VPSKIRGAPTNYLCVSKKDVTIEGQYFIDLSLPPAPQIVSDAESGGKNISLYTTSGAVIADVWVTGNNKLKRVSMKLCSDNGHVCAKIVRLNPRPSVVQSKITPKRIKHDIFSDGESELRPSLGIDLRANHGDISLSLPRCFRGPITITSSHERIKFSDALEERVAPLSDIQGVRVYFVGDRPRSGQWRGDDNEGEEHASTSESTEEEPLDELTVSGWHTSVRINWDGEPELPEMKPNGWENFCRGSARFFTSGRVN